MAPPLPTTRDPACIAAIEKWKQDNVQEDGTYPKNCTVANGRQAIVDVFEPLLLPLGKTQLQITKIVSVQVRSMVGAIRCGDRAGKDVKIVAKEAKQKWTENNPTRTRDYWQENAANFAERRKNRELNMTEEEKAALRDSRAAATRKHQHSWSEERKAEQYQKNNEYRKNQAAKKKEETVLSWNAFVDEHADKHAANTPDNQLVSELMDMDYASKKSSDEQLRELRKLQHYSIVLYDNLRPLPAQEIAKYPAFRGYEGKFLIPHRADDKKIKAVWGATAHLQGGVDFVVRHHEKEIVTMVRKNTPRGGTAIISVDGYILGPLHPDYPRFATFNHGKYKHTKSFALSREPVRVGENVQDFALVRVDVEVTLSRLGKTIEKSKIASLPRVLTNTMKNRSLDLSDPEVVAMVNQQFKSPLEKENAAKQKSTDIESDEDEDGDENGDEVDTESEDDEPTWDSWIADDVSKLVTDVTMLTEWKIAQDSKPAANEKRKRASLGTPSRSTRRKAAPKPPPNSATTRASSGILGLRKIASKKAAPKVNLKDDKTSLEEDEFYAFDDNASVDASTHRV